MKARSVVALERLAPDIPSMGADYFVDGEESR